MSEEDRAKLYGILREHWCPEFPYGESCKHCSLELEICEPIDKILNPCFPPDEVKK